MLERIWPILFPTMALLLSSGAAGKSTELGKPLWVGRPVIFCTVPDRTSKQCVFLDTHDQFVASRVEMGAQRDRYMQITLKDGRAGFVRESDLNESSVESDPVATEGAQNALRAAASKECKKHGPPKIGMTYKELTATCWGKPDTVNRTQTAGLILDQFVYGDGRYVYLRNGIVTSIQTSGSLR